MAVTLTEAAAKHVQKFLTRRGKGVGLRLGVGKAQPRIDGDGLERKRRAFVRALQLRPRQHGGGNFIRRGAGGANCREAPFVWEIKGEHGKTYRLF